MSSALDGSMDLLVRFEEACSKRPKRIVLPESEDARILKAASIVADKCLATPILVGIQEEVDARARDLKIDLSDVEIAPSSGHPRMEDFVDEYLAMRGSGRITPQIAAKVLSKPLHLASMMVRMGESDGVVAGARNFTSSVIKAGKLFIGLEAGLSEPSSFFVVDVPKHGLLVFADCAVNPDPGPKLLAQIAIASASSARRLLAFEPRVAMLSFSTKGSADHSEVRKVAEATEIAKSLAPDLRIDGEMQADSALVPEIAERKKAADVLGGRANVLIFPDLNAGNIAYKLVRHLAEASTYGPFLQGFRRPINDLSRACTIDEIIGTILVTSIQAGGAG